LDDRDLRLCVAAGGPEEHLTIELESEDAERRDIPKVQIERPGHRGKVKEHVPTTVDFG
jgi:hypothetical protein